MKEKWENQEDRPREEKKRTRQSDKKAHGRIGSLLKEKYGIDFTPVIDKDFIQEERDKGFYDY